MADSFVTAMPYRTTAPSLPSATSPIPTDMPFASQGPTFQNILDLYKNNPTTINAMQPVAGGNNFQLGIDTLAPSNGIRPEIQKALDLIRERGETAKTKNVSDATALALRRGIGGSSTELFGVGEAMAAADEATASQEANLLLENARREQALQDARAKGYFDRSNTEANLGAQLGINTANLTNDQLTKLAALTSDEIASLRNMDFGNRQLTLEALLGQQGLDIARENIGVSRDIAQDAARMNLIGSLGGAFLPSILNAGSAVLGGGGVAGATGAGAMGIPLAGAGAAGSGVGLASAGGLGLLALGGLGASAISNAGQKAGGTLGGIIANPIGYQINLAKDALSSGGNAVKNVASKVGNAVKDVFPF